LKASGASRLTPRQAIYPQERFTGESLAQIDQTTAAGRTMQTMTQIDEQRRRKNIRAALILAALVVLIMISSIPFWKGLLQFAINN
jgi:hypothetical protein